VDNRLRATTPALPISERPVRFRRISQIMQRLYYGWFIAASCFFILGMTVGVPL
jgi:hypothetical protein